ncbi:MULTISPECIES: hypothetical protein [Methylobacterium]|uniref:hypothetical protein n=1 Tax=Methylobacterium TaxID=407 RepID=UPI0008E6DCE5|nr:MULTISPECIES: hypothetical protein [Methylobacterium]MBZ6416459.1 hypothetical protein [Methylobacterium sp.]MBK3400036.1 hypothetical protein [Methylobacterium ajmalii]MBK3409404.1 hypothetical protein [Methylobacterium ajmalii]MBK3422721.1 hypothetical protein [Methylobacterium ajmalii]SFF49455.1 hypothetical protein SAMN04487844_12286 [Methylobacterium sp. yr596]
MVSSQGRRARRLPRGVAPPDPALCRVQAACRLCGFPVRGFRHGTTCVLRIDRLALHSACRGAEHACPGLQEAVRAARCPADRA